MCSSDLTLSAGTGYEKDGLRVSVQAGSINTRGINAIRNPGNTNFNLDTDPYRNLNLTAKIARAAGAEDGGTFYEVGPGPGGLTRALLGEGADKVIAVERDTRCLPALEEIAAAYPGKLEVISADALAALDHFNAGTHAQRDLSRVA